VSCSGASGKVLVFFEVGYLLRSIDLVEAENDLRRHLGAGCLRDVGAGSCHEVLF